MGGLVLLGGGMLPHNAAEGLAATAVLAVRSLLWKCRSFLAQSSSCASPQICMNLLVSGVWLAERGQHWWRVPHHAAHAGHVQAAWRSGRAPAPVRHSRRDTARLVRRRAEHGPAGGQQHGVPGRIRYVASDRARLFSLGAGIEEGGCTLETQRSALSSTAAQCGLAV